MNEIKHPSTANESAATAPERKTHVAQRKQESPNQAALTVQDNQENQDLSALTAQENKANQDAHPEPDSSPEKSPACKPGSSAPSAIPFTPKEWGLAAAAVVAAFLGLQSTVYANGLGFGVTLSALLLIAVSSIYLRKTHGKPSHASHFYLLLTAAAAGLYSLNGAHSVLMILRFPLLVSLYAYWLCVAGGAANAPKLMPSAVFDVLHTVFAAPFSGIGNALRGMTSGMRGRKNVPLALLGIVIALPLLLIVISLLSGADKGFADAVSAFTGWLDTRLGDTLFRILLTALTALLLLSMWLSILRDRRGAARRQAPARCIPAVIPAVVITLLSAVYIAFFAAQVTSIGQVLRARQAGTPLGGAMEGFTYSDFAREGFFQLCVVCGINFIVVLIANYLANEKNRALRLLISLLGACTLLLTASALFRMLLYIDVYGLTPLRIITSWFMLMLALAFSAIVLSQWKENVPVFKISALSLCVSLIALNALNPAKISADYNADAYLRGALNEFDYEAFSHDAPYAADAVYRVFEETEDDVLKSALAARFGSQTSLPADPMMLNMNAERLHADKVYKALSEKRRAFIVRVTPEPSLEISGIVIEYALDGKPAGTCGMQNADSTPLTPGETLAFDFCDTDLPENANLQTFSMQFFLVDEQGEMTPAGNEIGLLSAEYGREYDVLLSDALGSCDAVLLDDNRR